MPKLIISHTRLPEDALFDLLNRDASLWVCGPTPENPQTLERLAKFMALPWKVVLSELTSAELFLSLEKFGSQQDSLSRFRGFIHTVASDPSTRILPPRSLPIFLLNGREDATDTKESSNASGIAAMRRRLNMVERLEAAQPKRVFILGANYEDAVENLADLWGGEFRALLTFIVDPSMEVAAIAERFESVA